jgi:hypothetical protein
VLLMGMWIVCCMVPGWRPGEESCRRCAAWRELGRSCSASDGNVDCVLHGPGLAPGGKELSPLCGLEGVRKELWCF